MPFIEKLLRIDGGFVVELHRTDGFVYRSDVFVTESSARRSARKWRFWHDHVADGTVDSVYYIVAISSIWAGPPPGAHKYSGLRVKIGRARDVLKRLANLRTGTTDDLIVHALEPGGAEVEAERHREFESDRLDNGREWFACTPRLVEHIWETWRRNNVLPPAHQIEVGRLLERIEAYSRMRSLIGTPDMVNPGFNEPWHGKVFVDLAYRGWRVSIGKPLVPNAIPLDPRTLQPVPEPPSGPSSDDDPDE